MLLGLELPRGSAGRGDELVLVVAFGGEDGRVTTCAVAIGAAPGVLGRTTGTVARCLGAARDATRESY